MLDQEDRLWATLSQRLKARHFALLSSVYRHRSLRKVAEEMSLSQPAITKALKELEEIVGTNLFERTARGLVPTPSATLLETRSNAFLADLRKLARELTAVRAGFQGVFTVGIIRFISFGLLIRALDLIRQRGGEYRFVVLDGRTDEMVNMLMAHEIDCVIGRLSHEHADKLHQEVLYTQRAALVANRAYSLPVGRKLVLDNLNDLHWLLPPRTTPTRRAMEEMFIRQGVVIPVPWLETTSLGVLRAALASDESAVTILPTELAHEIAEEPAYRVLPIELDLALPPVSLLTRKEAKGDQMLQMLLQAIRDAAAS